METTEFPFLLSTLSATLAATLSAFIAGFVFFLLRERVLNGVDISGKWEMTSIVTQTSFNTYRGMELRHDVMFAESSSAISGIMEKKFEKTKGNRGRQYNSSQIKFSQIKGHYQRFYLPMFTDTIHFISTDYGEKRKSHTYYKLRVISDMEINGVFYSTAAKSSGICLLRKTK